MRSRQRERVDDAGNMFKNLVYSETDTEALKKSVTMIRVSRNSERNLRVSKKSVTSARVLKKLATKTRVSRNSEGTLRVSKKSVTKTRVLRNLARTLRVPKSNLNRT